MKYSAKRMTDGKWAVFTGKSYFTATVTDTQKVAERKALVMSAQWYYNQACEAYEIAEKKGLLDEYDGSLGDWLC